MVVNRLKKALPWAMLYTTSARPPGGPRPPPARQAAAQANAPMHVPSRVIGIGMRDLTHICISSMNSKTYMRYGN